MLLEKRNLIIVGVTIGIVTIAAIAIGFAVQTNKSETATEVYVDPGSGETIITDNKSPQGSEASLKNAIIYPGFSKLLDRGLSTEEIQSIQTTIAEYSLEQEERFKEVSLVVASMRYVKSSENPEISSLTFELKVNRKNDYYMTVTPIDDETSTTKLFAADKTTLLIER